MDKRLIQILESLLLNTQMINQEVQRLERSEQFSHSMHCFQLIERICQNSLCTIQVARSVERKLYRQKYLGEGERQAAVYPIVTSKFPANE